MYQVISFRGADLGNCLTLKINGKEVNFPVEVPDIANFNVRLIVQLYPDYSLNKEAIWGKVILPQHDFYSGSIYSITIGRKDKSVLDTASSALLTTENNRVSCTIFSDVPVHAYDVLAAIPLPTNILTILLDISAAEAMPIPQETIAKHFDAYSHLGFCLVDFARLKEVMQAAYPDGADVDLIAAFAQTEMIDTLFEKGIIIVTWGFNPFTYPIYSVKNDRDLLQIFGKTYEGNAQGVYKIDAAISELSLIPGNELRSWNRMKEQSWPKIPLIGKGERVVLQPRKLVDDDGDATTIVSFVLYREEGPVEETNPLLNMDLLYT